MSVPAAPALTRREVRIGDVRDAIAGVDLGLRGDVEAGDVEARAASNSTIAADRA
jgi:hypothetical protein